MSLGKLVFFTVLLLFGAIGAAGLWKKRVPASSSLSTAPLVEEVPLQAAAQPEPVRSLAVEAPMKSAPQVTGDKDLPAADRISQLFALDSSKLPFVETVSYTSRVPWLKGRPAWVADYASHFATSRHFIARSLNQKSDYFTQKIAPGDRFNVFKRDKNLEFHLVIDLSRCTLWFYGVDVDEGLKYLLKTYRVGLGRLDPKRKSGSLTPIGTYLLGNRIAIYKPGMMGHFQDRQEEMIRIFGTRWIPFEKEVEGCTESAKGLGIHGAPWVLEEKSGALIEDSSKLGRYESDGCIRLASADMEELFAIVITKPTFVHLVKDFFDAKVPGIEPKEFLTPLSP